MASVLNEFASQNEAERRITTFLKSKWPSIQFSVGIYFSHEHKDYMVDIIAITPEGNRHRTIQPTGSWGATIPSHIADETIATLMLLIG